MKTLRLVRGWVCYRLVLLLPIRLSSPLYCWVLGWGGWYAHGADAVICLETGAPKDPHGCFNVRCNLGGTCCRSDIVAALHRERTAGVGVGCHQTFSQDTPTESKAKD